MKSRTELLSATGARNTASAILAAPGTLSIVLRPRRARQVFFLLVSLVFVGSGLLTRTPGTLLGAAFFGLGVIVFGIMLLPGAAYLGLDAEGFTTCTLFRKHRTSWRDVGMFGVTKVRRRLMVGYNSTETTEQRPRLTAVNVELTGYGCLLPDTYGLPGEELAAIMNEARRRALQAVV